MASNFVSERTVLINHPDSSEISENADLKNLSQRAEKTAKGSLDPLIRWMVETVPAIGDSSSFANQDISYPVKHSKSDDLENGGTKIGIEMYAPVHRDKMPIVIFSHGAGAHPSGYRPLLEKIAGQGYLVLCLNHTSSSELDSDTLNRLNASDFENLTSIQADNIRCVVGQLQNENGSLAQIRKIGLADQIVLAGHSLGGAASIMVSQSNPSQIAGCINLDGELKRANRLDKPVLTIFADHLNDQDLPEEERPQFEDWKTNEYSRMLKSWKSFHEKSSQSRIGKISGITHMDFISDSISPSPAQLKACETASKTMLEFMKKSVFQNIRSHSNRRCCCIL